MLTVKLGALGYSWKSFKILKERQIIDANLETCDRQEERAINLRVNAHLLRQEMKVVLQFWAAYAMLMIYELYVELVVFWIPFYYTFKFMLCVWLIAPKSGGPTFIFEQVIEPRMDLVSGWLEESGKPRMRQIMHRVQGALVTAYVTASLKVASEAHLQSVSDHLDELLVCIEKELEERKRRPSHHIRKVASENKSRLQPSKSVEFIDAAVVEKLSSIEEEKRMKSQASWKDSLANWTSYSVLPVGEVDYHPVETQSNRSGEKSPRRSKNWASSALQGVVELTKNTKNILTGRAVKSSGESAFDQYSQGFDSLSDCEDCDPTLSGSPTSPLVKSFDFDNANPDTMGLKQRKPTTRSQSKK